MKPIIKPIWTPEKKRIKDANLTRFNRFLIENRTAFFTNAESPPLSGDYEDLHRWSVQNPELFWSAIWSFFEVKGKRGPIPILKPSTSSIEGTHFFPEARLNFAENLLIKRDESIAIIERGEDGRRREISWSRLYQSVEALASSLKKAGIQPGDRIAGLMPNISETLIAMLATASIGAVWSSCSPDFGLQGVKDRFGQIKPRILFTTNGYYYGGKKISILDKLNQIIPELGSLEAVIVVDYLENDTINSIPEARNILTTSNNVSILHKWSAYLDACPEALQFEPMPFNAPLYIMYSSGTTGAPKCIVHGTGGTLLQHLKELSLHTDIKPGDRFFYYTTCGWMMWNWLVSGLSCGATLVLFDGSPFAPSPSVLWDMAEQEDITIFGAGAKYYAACQKAELKPAVSHHLPSLKTVLSTGSPLSHESYDYIYSQVKSDVCLSSISGGTDIVSCFALGCPTLPVYRGELQCIGLGMDVSFKADNKMDSKGELVCKTPFPSMPIYFWNDPFNEKYHHAYFDHFQGIWAHGDYGEIVIHAAESNLPEQHGVIIHGRSDAVLNPGGVRIGTAEIYRQVEKLDEILDSIAIGQQWEQDVRVVLFVILRGGTLLNEELKQKIRLIIRQNTTPRHVPAKILEVTDIPRTISGKIVELAVRDVVHGKAVKNTDALANPEALKQFRNRSELSSP